MKQKYVIAYDIGTSSVKVAMIDVKGRFMCASTVDYSLITPQPGWVEQDPEQYWNSVCRGTKQVMEKYGCDPSDAQGIAFSTMWKGIIPVDSVGSILHNSIIWLDNRASDQAERLNAHFNKKLFCGADYWPKLMWFRENCPELYAKAETIFETNSFLKWKATGVGMIDISNHFTRSFDPELQNFYNDYLRFCDIDINKIPPLAASTAFTGKTTEKGAAELGLVPGIPVFAGCSDLAAITIGSGSTATGSAHAYFGSSGWLGITSLHTSKDLYIAPFDEERDIKIYSIQAVGLSLNWSLRQLYRKEMEEMGSAIYDFINKEIADIPDGCEGLLATPWFYGERPPMLAENARGNFLNLSSCHDRRHMIKAVMEGVCCTFRLVSSEFWEFADEKPTYINAVGGGACSDIWMQTLANVLNVPISVPKYSQHAGSIGTAYCALIGLGYYNDFTAAAEMEIERRFMPQPEGVKAYQELYDVFVTLYDILSSRCFCK